MVSFVEWGDVLLTDHCSVTALYGTSRPVNSALHLLDTPAMSCHYRYHPICVRLFRVHAMHRRNYGTYVMECANKRFPVTNLISMPSLYAFCVSYICNMINFLAVFSVRRRICHRLRRCDVSTIRHSCRSRIGHVFA